MRTYAVVPVKQLATSKSRLATILTPEDRKRLTLAMLEDVLTAIRNSAIQGTVVVGSDLCVCELAKNAGVAFINEEGRGLNRAIRDSITCCMQRGADSALVLLADIPLLSSTNIDRIIELAGIAESIVVVSSSKNGGTKRSLLETTKPDSDKLRTRKLQETHQACSVQRHPCKNILPSQLHLT